MTKRKNPKYSAQHISSGVTGQVQKQSNPCVNYVPAFKRCHLTAPGAPPQPHNHLGSSFLSVATSHTEWSLWCHRGIVRSCTIFFLYHHNFLKLALKLAWLYSVIAIFQMNWAYTTCILFSWFLCMHCDVIWANNSKKWKREQFSTGSTLQPCKAHSLSGPSNICSTNREEV